MASAETRLHRDSIREELPAFIEPMLVASGPVPSGDEWALEVKWDGARAQLRSDRGAMSLRSMSGRSCTDQFPEVVEPHTGLTQHRLLLDGEIVARAEDGTPDFEALRSRLRAHDETAVRRARSAAPATLMIFDLLHLDGRSVRHLPYGRRRELLAELELSHQTWQVPADFPATGELPQTTRELGLEGVVAKRLTSAYVPGPRRTSHWIKSTHRRRETFVISGWLPAGDDGLESFLLSRPGSDGRLHYVGSAKFGLDTAARTLLRRAMRPPRGRATRIGELVVAFEVDVEFHGREGALRDPVMRNLRAADGNADR